MSKKWFRVKILFDDRLGFRLVPSGTIPTHHSWASGVWQAGTVGEFLHGDVLGYVGRMIINDGLRIKNGMYQPLEDLIIKTAPKRYEARLEELKSVQVPLYAIAAGLKAKLRGIESEINFIKYNAQRLADEKEYRAKKRERREKRRASNSRSGTTITP